MFYDYSHFLTLDVYLSVYITRRRVQRHGRNINHFNRGNFEKLRDRVSRMVRVYGIGAL